jgi:hypothetical protein
MAPLGTNATFKVGVKMGARNDSTKYFVTTLKNLVFHAYMHSRIQVIKEIKEIHSSWSRTSKDDKLKLGQTWWVL